MALIDELTQRIAAELHSHLDEVVRHAIESYVVGNGSDQTVPIPRTERRGRPRRATSAKRSRENRSRTIIDAVAKLGEATIEDVAKATGLDKRGVGSSLHYLAAAGKLRHAGVGKYRTARAARAA
ncbi:MAG TPA: hypothetical protein VGK48_00080 [Terriglobia bacterium]|jgi:predicted HTH transcriptional regulator